MQQIDLAGQRLTEAVFVKCFRVARGIAPTRFLTLRLHPTTFRELSTAAEAPETIVIGDTPAPLGGKYTRINCVTVPFGVGDGAIVKQDEQMDPHTLEFQVHGIAELEIINLG